MTDPQSLLRHPGSLSAYREGEHWIVDVETGCWNWAGTRDRHGYGHCTHGRAHRVVFMQFGHELSSDDHLHHRCENKSCVNPAHLEPMPPLVHRTLHAQGDSNLTWDDVREIRARAHAGEVINDLAAEFDLSLGTIHPLIAGRTWEDPTYSRPTWERDCVECGEAFFTHRSNQRFCCGHHRNLYNGRRSNRRYRGVDPDGPVRSYTRRAA